MATNTTSLQFNGLGRRATLSTNVSIRNMQSFTWMAWVKVGPTSNSPYQKLYVERQGSGNKIRFSASAYHNRLRFELATVDGKTDTNYDYVYNWDDRWHHIAYVAHISGENPTYAMYLDASKVASGTLIKPSGTDAVSNTAPLGVYLGCHSVVTPDVFPSDRFWDGWIDEVLLFNEAKADNDITTYFTSRNTWDMNDTAMFSYWRFDEGGGSSTVDSDNASWTGTLYSNNTPSGALWAADRPFLGNGVLDTSAPTTPSAPITSNVTSQGFTASWTGSTDNIAVQYYELQVSQFSDFSSFQSFNNGLNVTRAVTDLLSSTNYYWRVRAIDAALNTSGYSTTQSLTTQGVGDLVAPTPPTNLRASSVTFSSFVLTWDASVSTDVNGYKVDVAHDSDFTTYLTGWVNKDVGNVLTVPINGTQALSTYYVRLRAYDLVQNEGIESATLVVQTPSQPDLIPPSIVETKAATSVTSRAFTANWNEAQDNVGVVSYDVDFSLAADFSSIVQSVQLGNILSYRKEDATPNTTYYYRVRARDAAGNISQNATEGEFVTTTPSSVDEGGYITMAVEPIGDAYVDSALTTTNFGTSADLLVAGDGSVSTKAAHILFDATSVSGTLQSAVLQLYVVGTATSAYNYGAYNAGPFGGGTTATVQVYVAATTFDETTITWANQPTVAGVPLTITSLMIGQWVSIDISSLITVAGIYDVKLVVTSNDTITFASRETTTAPHVELEYDPATATSVQEITASDVAQARMNVCTNPNFESGVVTGWFKTGASGQTLVVNATQGVNGTKALETVCDGTVASQGVAYGSSVLTPVINGDTWTWSIQVKASVPVTMTLQINEQGPSGILHATGHNIAVTTSYQTFTVTKKITDPAVLYMYLLTFMSGAQAATVWVDKALLEKSEQAGAYFDGNTSGAYWTGTANLSISAMPSARIVTTSSYIGDSDGDNAANALFRLNGENEWIDLTLPLTMNRTTKQGSLTLGPSYGEYNYCTNPSFEIDTTGWTAQGGTIAQTTTSFTEGNASLLVTTPAPIGQGVYTDNTPTVAGQKWSAQASILASTNITVKLALQYLNSSLTLLSETAPTIGTNAFTGTGEWMTFNVTEIAPTNTAYVRILVVAYAGTEVGTFMVDRVQLNPGTIRPYRDGSRIDAIWQGVPYQSRTGLIIIPQATYDIAHQYTDPDGFYDGPSLVSSTYTTGAIPDNVTTASTLILTPERESIAAQLTYVGDDNENMMVAVKWKRTDLSSWSDTSSYINRETKTITSTINNLQPGTSYTVQMVLTDPDGVYGATNNTVSAAATTLLDADTAEGVSRILFGGFVLMDGAAVERSIGVVKHDAFGFPDRRVQVETLPRVDGAVELQNLWGSRTITMTGFVSGNTRGELDDNLSALRRALAPKRQQLVIDTLSNEGRHYYATCQSLAIVEEAGVNIRHLTWDAEFICADPFAYDSSITVVPEFTAYDSSSLTINNFGDLPVYPVFKIRTLHTRAVTLTIINNTTGERIQPLPTIISGDRMVIDSERLSVTKNGIEVEYVGGFPRLNVNDNNFSFYISAVGTSPSILVEAQYQQRFL